MTYAEICSALRAAGVENPGADARLLLEHFCGVSPAAAGFPQAFLTLYIPAVQGREAEAHRQGDPPALRLVPGGVVLPPQLPQEEAPEGVLPGPGPDIL